MKAKHPRQAEGLPSRVKPTLMRLPWRVWKRLVYPLWLRWYKWHLRSRLWQDGPYELGDVCYWRGVKLVCGLKHFCGSYAEHPWDPGAGWPEHGAAMLWEPMRRRDRFLLALVGDKRKRPVSEKGGVGDSSDPRESVSGEAL